MPLVFYGFLFGSVVLASLATYVPVAERTKHYLQMRATEATFQLEDMFVTLSQHRLQLLHVLAPAGLGLLFWVATQQVVAGAVGAALGLSVPKLTLKVMKAKRRSKFHTQLVDSLLLLSSCLRAGLSMTQSFTVIAEEMPTPVNQEFGLVLKETRMGVSLDEAMTHFRQRMPSDDSNLFVTAVLVSRETGGDVTAIFTKLVETLRERKKIKEKIKTLTFMARMQAIVMGLLPIAFIFVTYSIDKSHFMFFLKDHTGQLLLGGVVLVQLLGAAMFLRFSRSPL